MRKMKGTAAHHVALTPLAPEGLLTADRGHLSQPAARARQHSQHKAAELQSDRNRHFQGTATRSQIAG